MADKQIGANNSSVVLQANAACDSIWFSGRWGERSNTISESDVLNFAVLY